jgi:hypothetical protein
MHDRILQAIVFGAWSVALATLDSVRVVAPALRAGKARVETGGLTTLRCAIALPQRRQLPPDG